MKNKSLKISIGAAILLFSLLGLKNLLPSEYISNERILQSLKPVPVLIYETAEKFFEAKSFDATILDEKIIEKENSLAEGLNLYYQGKYQESINYYTEILKENPDNEVAYNRRGNVYYLKLNEYDLAIADYSRALKINAIYWKPYFNRGNVFEMLGNYGEAISDYDKAIALNPNFSVAYESRGYCYLMLGETKKALTDFAKAKIFDYKN